MPLSDSLRLNLGWYHLRARVAGLDFGDRLRSRLVVGACPVVVSLTTHGNRLARVHTSIQSIVAGRVRPRRLILWLNGKHDERALPEPLKRLRQRGLEIRYAPNFGPHTKYYPYVMQFADEGLPLVTADDDAIYARDWLQGLVAAHQTDPDSVHCYRARELAIEDGRIKPYRTWKAVTNREPSPRHFALGVSGVIYPPALLRAMRAAGDTFMQTCPKADDIWLHAMALRNGTQVRQVGDQGNDPIQVPFTQDCALFHSNFLPTGNDAQIRATYSQGDLLSLSRAR